MVKPLSFFNGQLVPQSEARIPFFDAGFVLGATMTEQLRTFAGKLFQLDKHLDRLGQSLQFAGMEMPYSRDVMVSRAKELTNHNRQLLHEDDDLGLAIFVTPGPYATLARDEPCGCTVGMHTYPLPFDLWADRYNNGQRLVLTGIRQVPTNCWSRSIKCRSRLHYYLADQEARREDAKAKALILDQDGSVLETSTTNILVYQNRRGILSPPLEKILPGVSLDFVRTIMTKRGIPFVETDIWPDDLEQADEVILTSTPFCLLPVVSFVDQPIGRGQPGQVYRDLLADWNTHVSVDIPRQAQRFSQRVSSAKKA